jgi:hypothetical protein
MVTFFVDSGTEQNQFAGLFSNSWNSLEAELNFSFVVCKVKTCGL